MNGLATVFAARRRRVVRRVQIVGLGSGARVGQNFDLRARRRHTRTFWFLQRLTVRPEEARGQNVFTKSVRTVAQTANQQQGQHETGQNSHESRGLENRIAAAMRFSGTPKGYLKRAICSQISTKRAKMGLALSKDNWKIGVRVGLECGL